MRLMGHATDDGFTDFRAWLISQGKEAYFAALKEPDTLADLDPGDGYWFESFAYAGYYALKELTGEDAFDNMSETTGEMIEEALKADIEYSEGINYPYEAYDLPNYFPRLFQKSVMGSWENEEDEIRGSSAIGNGCVKMLTRTASDRFYITAKEEDGYFALYYHPADNPESQKMREVKAELNLTRPIQYDRGLCYVDAGWAGPILFLWSRALILSPGTMSRNMDRSTSHLPGQR